MISSPYLDAIIAILLVLLIFSSIVSLIVEYINNYDTRQKRQMFLYNSIRHALDDLQGMSWSRLLYDVPVVRAYIAARTRYPSYLSASIFTEALLTVIQDYSKTMVPEPAAVQKPLWQRLRGRRYDAAVIASVQPSDYEKMAGYVDNLPAGKLKELMTSFLIVAGDASLEAIRKNIRIWFNNYQNQVTAEFKRSTRTDSLWVGVGLAMFLNINFISIVYEIVNNGDLRTSLVSQAEQAVRDSLFVDTDFVCPDCSPEKYDAGYEEFLKKRLAWADTTVFALRTSGLPLGWQIPRSSESLRKEYLSLEIIRLRQVIGDTSAHLLRKYCLAGALSGEGVQKDTLHKFTTALLRIESPGAHHVDSLVASYGVKAPPGFSKELRYFFRKIERTDSVAGCLTSTARNTAYGTCLGDCSAIDRIVYIDGIQEVLNERIRNNEMEIEYYDKHLATSLLDRLAEGVTFPLRVLQHNIHSWKDGFLYFMGTVVMGFLISSSSSLWFQLLVRFFQIRLTGPKAGRKTAL